MRNHKRIYKSLLVTCLWLSVNYSHAQVNSDSLISVYQKKMERYLNKENAVAETFLFTKAGIEVFSLSTDSTPKRFQYGFMWGEMNILKDMLFNVSTKRILKICDDKSDPFTEEDKKEIYSVKKVQRTKKISAEKKLNGVRIALDPGHIGGDIEQAKKEKKWVEMKGNPPIQLIEGNLTFATAKILQKKLEKEGATVILTRNDEGVSSFGFSYEKWKDSLFLRSLDSAFARGDVSFEEKNFLLHKANDTEILRRFFLQEEMRERARKINEFHPDFTLIIHYNVDETNKEWNKPTKKDFNMAFVGGSFSADELDKPEARIDFLRLLLSDDIESSIDFSKYMVQSLVEKTKVPAAFDSCAIYLKGNCITTDAPGVFCRNLALTRMVRGTLCYGESLYQDNMNECKALSKNEITVDGIKTSKRVEEVADAYFNGIMNYVKSKK